MVPSGWIVQESLEVALVQGPANSEVRSGIGVVAVADVRQVAGLAWETIWPEGALDGGSGIPHSWVTAPVQLRRLIAVPDIQPVGAVESRHLPLYGSKIMPLSPDTHCWLA